mgnify:CR=1 FL=1
MCALASDGGFGLRPPLPGRPPCLGFFRLRLSCSSVLSANADTAAISAMLLMACFETTVFYACSCTYRQRRFFNREF